MDPRKQIIEIAKRLHSEKMLAAADGNISYRLSRSRILITPSGVSKARMKQAEFAIIDLNGRVLKGKPSSESQMHLAVYQRCPKAKAVVHAHPPTAIAWTIAHPKLKELPAQAMSELILAVGRIPIVSYQRPGTGALAKALKDYLPKHRVMVLARHGALTWGESLEEAYAGMERLEHTAIILKTAEELGGISSLPPSEIRWLRALRKKLGERIL